MYTADLHCDTILAIWLSELKGERLSLRDTAGAAEPLHLDLHKMRAGGYLLQNFALFANLHMPARMLTSGRYDPSQQMPGAAMSSQSGANAARTVPSRGASVEAGVSAKARTSANSADSASAHSPEFVDPWFQTMEMIRVFREEMAAGADLIGQVFTWDDIETNRRAGRMSALLTTEEGGIIRGDISRLDTLYDAGVRMMTPSLVIIRRS